MVSPGKLTSRKKVNNAESERGRLNNDTNNHSDEAINSRPKNNNSIKRNTSRSNGLLPALCVILFVFGAMIIASNTNNQQLKDILHLKFHKSIQLVEEHKKTVTEKYKQVTNTIDEEEFIRRKKEIRILKADVYTKTGSIDKLSQEIEQYEEQLEILKKGMRKIKGDITRFCYDCKIFLGHNLNPTCGERLQFILDTHKDDEYFIKYALMDDYPQCRMPINVKLQNADFCYPCAYTGKNNAKAVCGSRLKFMMKKYGGDEEHMKQRIIDEYPACKKSAKKDVSGFCSYCVITIGKGRFTRSVSCDKRMEFLSATYGDDKDDAKIALMNDYPDSCKKDKDKDVSSSNNNTSIFCPSCKLSMGPKSKLKIITCGARLKYLVEVYGDIVEHKEDLIDQYPECKLNFCGQCNITVIVNNTSTQTATATTTNVNVEKNHTTNNSATTAIEKKYDGKNATNATTQEQQHIIETTCLDQVNFYVDRYGREEDFVKDRIAKKYPICKQNNFGYCCERSASAIVDLNNKGSNGTSITT